MPPVTVIDCGNWLVTSVGTTIGGTNVLGGGVNGFWGVIVDGPYVPWEKVNCGVLNATASSPAETAAVAMLERNFLRLGLMCLLLVLASVQGCNRPTIR